MLRRTVYFTPTLNDMKLIQWYWREPNFKGLMFAFLFGGPFWDLFAVIVNKTPELLATYLTYGLVVVIHTGLVVASTSTRIRKNHGL